MPDASPTPPCAFCDIAAGRAPRWLRHEEEGLIVFHNLLAWLPVMLLVAPKAHMTQEEFWASELFPRASRLAVELGRQDCPNGFRVLSNFGLDALQTQVHGHLHVVGGATMGIYINPDWQGFIPPGNYAGASPSGL